MTDSRFPSFDDLQQFVLDYPKCTICEIRDHFQQKGSSVIFNTRNQVLAYGINSDFFRHLQQFIKQHNVKMEINALACITSDSTRYTGKERLFPIVLSIRN
jgi:hypothetical protein